MYIYIYIYYIYVNMKVPMAFYFSAKTACLGKIKLSSYDLKTSRPIRM